MARDKTFNDSVKLGFLIHDVARLMRTAYDQKTKPLGLTRSQWWVLVYLQRQDGLTQQELADVLDVGKVTLTGLLNRLEQKGWVERRPHEYDKRAKRVFLTDKVHATIEAMREVASDLLHGIASELTKDEMEGAEDILQKLRQKLAEMNSSPEKNRRRKAAEMLPVPAERSEPTPR